MFSKLKGFLTVFNIVISLLVLGVICASLVLIFQLKGDGNKVLLDEPQFTNGYDVNKIVGIDEFGRTIQPLFNTKKDKYVGIFYFVCLGQHASTGIYDTTEILLNHPDDLFNKEGTKYSPLGQHHYWGKPLLGYYNSLDEYVMRKHIEQLTYAGVDFIVFDVSNGVTYDSVWRKLLKLLEEYQKDGWNVPKVAFYTNFNSEQVMYKLYTNIYKKAYCESIWFKPDGVKPLIIGKLDDGKLDMEKTVQDFFYFKDAQWPTEAPLENGFPWMDWVRPQRNYNGVMNVSVAQHPAVPMSDTYLNGAKNWDRGYTSLNPVNGNMEAVLRGANIQEQWDYAISVDPNIIFVTGWNEWGATKSIYEEGTPRERVMFVDSFNIALSRDIEPMSGGYNDAFYVQLIQNIRKYKGITAKLPKAVKSTIDINGDLSNWDNITNIYRNISKTGYERNSVDFTNKTKLEFAAPKNSINEIRMTNDSDNIYVLIKTDQNIVLDTLSKNFLNLFIGVSDVSNQGWNSYSYVINRTPNNEGKTSLEKIDADFSVISQTNVDYTIKDNYIQFKIPRTDLKITSRSFKLYFKAADSVEKQNDIMDYYVTGSVVPVGRLSYLYVG